MLIADGGRVARARGRQRRPALPRVRGRVVHLHYVQERVAVVAACEQRGRQRGGGRGEREERSYRPMA
ncbi:unnamed protein product [Pieris brassicae]|uniref:Uncharacterized protein n=1 Tax=Pieris brassicae TaxID=7116 RepID=A0A9P0X949_PIEBR|nr:unnamed protein product [Pieris brassicae]